MSFYDIEGNVSTFMTKAGYRNHDQCKTDIVNALRHYRGLTPKLDKFIFNDGNQKELLVLAGTVPVPYKGMNYNIPISLWILDTHPYHAPMCFVCPTHDMQIRVSRHVDHTGKIYLPYLHEWNSVNSDLLGLVQICIITFGEAPPVFAKTQGSSQQPPPRPPQPSANYPPLGQQPYMPYPPATQSSAAPPPVYPGYQPPGSGYPPQAASGSDNTLSHQDSLVNQMSLVSAVEDKIRRLLREEYSSKQGEIQSLRKTQDDLAASRNKIENYVRIMKEETNVLDRNIKTIQTQKSEVEATLAAMSDNDEIPVDDLVMVGCPLFRQLLNSYSEDAAIDDYIYYMGEALRQGVVDCETFLKNTRNSSRKQFVLRLTMQKCRAKAGLDVE